MNSLRDLRMRAKHWIYFWVSGALLLGAVSVAEAKKLVREFSGSRSTITAEFEVEAPWLIDWRVKSDYYQSMGISIVLINAEDDTHAGSVAKTKQPGDGLRLMNEGGRFRFRVDSSMANWTIKVEQLNEGEARLYTPKSNDAF